MTIIPTADYDVDANSAEATIYKTKFRGHGYLKIQQLKFNVN